MSSIRQNSKKQSDYQNRLAVIPNRLTNIQFLYGQLTSKLQFLKIVSKEFNVDLATLESKWFCFETASEIPLGYESRITQLLQNIVRNKNIPVY